MFLITWVFDKLGYMPKINCEVGKVTLDVKSPEFGAWPFPAETPKAKPTPKTKPKVAKKPAVKRASTRKPKPKTK